MYRAMAAFDLDRTLLNDEKKIPNENLKVLKQLRQNNILPVIATGRDRFEVQDVIQDGDFQAVVSANGSDVWYQQQTLFEDNLTQDTLQRLLKWIDQHQICIALSNHDQIIVNRIDQYVRINYRRIHKDLPRVSNKLELTTNVTKALVFLPLTTAGKKLEADMRELFPELMIYRNSDVCIDLVGLAGTKADGLERLRQKLQLQEAPLYTFGDGINDISMLKTADYGIAMGNAPKEVQKEADYVTKAYDQNGIRSALQYFKLI